MTLSTRNIGIVAHVDAGKTTLTEQLLYVAGATRSAGSVDEGTSATDSLAVERERGISVRLATETFDWQGYQINLIDTPGHLDFSAEVERSLRALDCAILVISAVEGVQANTSGIFEALNTLRIPTIIFINKLDRMGANVNAVLTEIHQELSRDCVLLQHTINVGESSDANIACDWNASSFNQHQTDPSDSTMFIEPVIEKLTEYNDELLEQVIDGKTISFETFNTQLTQSIHEARLYPVVTGVAKNALGIEQLLTAITNYLPCAQGDTEQPLSAVIFKIEHDKTLGKTAYIRVFNGQIKARDKIVNATRSSDKQTVEEKVSQIKRVYNGKYQDIDIISAGEIGVVSGLSIAKVGDVLGDDSKVPNAYRLSIPLLTVQVKPVEEKDYANLANALKQLADEDPLLNLEWLTEQRELHINICGWIQVEILETILADRFNLKATFEQPSIIYKETPKTSAEGYERYWMPKPCWAIVKFLIEPGTRGSGVVYQSKVGVNDIAAKYQNEIEATINTALKQGIKGWQLTDIKITLIEGSDHNIHSRSGDFIIATPMAIMNGLVKSDTELLEPILDFQINADAELLGTITSDITKMRGQFNSPEFSGNRVILRGTVPAATSIEYPIQLASTSNGNAKLITRLAGYAPCAIEDGKTAEYRGINPLDRDKYILWARGAIK